MEKGMVVGSGLAQKFQRAHKNDPTYKECKTYAAKNLFKKDWLARKLNEARIGRVHTRRYQRVDAKKGVYLLFPAVSALFSVRTFFARPREEFCKKGPPC